MGMKKPRCSHESAGRKCVLACLAPLALLYGLAYLAALASLYLRCMTTPFRACLILAMLFGAALLVVLYRNGQNGRYQMHVKDHVTTVVLDTRTGELRYDAEPGASYSSENDPLDLGRPQ